MGKDSCNIYLRKARRLLQSTNRLESSSFSFQFSSLLIHFGSLLVCFFFQVGATSFSPIYPFVFFGDHGFYSRKLICFMVSSLCKRFSFIVTEVHYFLPLAISIRYTSSLLFKIPEYLFFLPI